MISQRVVEAAFPSQGLMFEMESTCVVCQSQSPKYKCSTCYVSYCSSECWKTHKSGDNCKRPDKVEDNHKVKCEKPYVTGDTIPQENLEKLDSNNDLKQLLKDPLLQKLLIGVDCSPDPYEAVQKAMQDPSFVQFVDLCLEMVEGSEEKSVSS